MANICEYFELNNSHLQISPLEHLHVQKGMQFIENWFDPGFAVWWQTLTLWPKYSVLRYTVSL